GEQSRLEACGSYVDDDSGFRQRNGIVAQGYGFARLDQVLNVQINGLAKISKRLVMSVAPSVAALQRWTRSVPGFAPIFELVRFNTNFEDVRLHEGLTSVLPIRLSHFAWR